MSSNITRRKLYIDEHTIFRADRNSVVAGYDISPDNKHAKSYLSNELSCSCGSIHFSGHISSSNNIHRERLVWSNTSRDQCNGVIDSAKVLIPEQSTQDIKIDFHLRFLLPGHYRLYFEFFAADSQIYSKILEVDISDNFRNHIDIYRIKQRDMRSVEWSVDWLNKDRSIDNISLCAYNQSSTERRTNIFSQIISSNSVENSVGLTHVIVLPKTSISEDDTPDNISLIYDGQSYSIDGIRDVVENDYFIFDTKRSYRVWNSTFEEDSELSAPIETVIFIRKNFSQVNKIKIDNPENKLKTFVDEFRFFPLLHTIEEVDLSKPIYATDVLYLNPVLSFSSKIEQCRWEFKNMTTLESVFSSYINFADYADGRYQGDRGTEVRGGNESSIFASINRKKLNTGYYNIILHYKLADDLQQHTFEIDSAFLYISD